ncbi:hypothetical protein [Sinorhizobium medicae]|uniref:hypothetical protein n=1 Tax=Sinorhizobium medicae TaxID=110321 RepID=UPI001F1EF68A|nr:hypothetical protein [Sinorhizobium medicae]
MISAKPLKEPAPQKSLKDEGVSVLAPSYEKELMPDSSEKNPGLHDNFSDNDELKTAALADGIATDLSSRSVASSRTSLTESAAGDLALSVGEGFSFSLDVGDLPSNGDADLASGPSTEGSVEPTGPDFQHEIVQGANLLTNAGDSNPGGNPRVTPERSDDALGEDQ